MYLYIKNANQVVIFEKILFFQIITKKIKPICIKNTNQADFVFENLFLSFFMKSNSSSSSGWFPKPQFGQCT